MSGHTPGPWELDGVEIYPVNGHRASDAICQLSAGQSDEAFEANAHLIAAAPELLVAAQKVMQWWADHQYDTCGERGEWNVYDAEPDFVVAARAALIKARGEV